MPTAAARRCRARTPGTAHRARPLRFTGPGFAGIRRLLPSNKGMKSRGAGRPATPGRAPFYRATRFRQSVRRETDSSPLRKALRKTQEQQEQAEQPAYAGTDERLACPALVLVAAARPAATIACQRPGALAVPHVVCVGSNGRPGTVRRCAAAGLLAVASRPAVDRWTTPATPRHRRPGNRWTPRPPFVWSARRASPPALRMPCNYQGTRIDRASWDHPVRWDLTAACGIQFEIACEDAAPVSHFNLYLRSGGGWYVAGFAAPPRTSRR